MESTMYTIDGKTFELRHYGVKGMKWGVRRKRRDYLGPTGGVKGGPYRQEGTPAGARGGPRKQSPVGIVKNFKDKAAAHEAKSQAKHKARQDKVAAGISKFKADAAAHEAKSQAKHKARQDKVAAGVKNFKDKAAAHEAKTQARDKARQEKVANKAKRGAKAVAGTLAKIGEAFVVDQMFFNGIGTHACAEAIKVVGRATITGYTMARGGYDIKWYDKAGNRVG